MEKRILVVFFEPDVRFSGFVNHFLAEDGAEQSFFGRQALAGVLRVEESDHRATQQSIDAVDLYDPKVELR